MTLDPGAGLGRHSLLVLGVNAGPGQAEAARHLGVAVLGRQVQGLHPLAVGQVHVAPEGTQGLSQPQLPRPGAHVHRGLALPVHDVKVGPGVE